MAEACRASCWGAACASEISWRRQSKPVYMMPPKGGRTPKRTSRITRTRRLESKIGLAIADDSLLLNGFTPLRSGVFTAAILLPSYDSRPRYGRHARIARFSEGVLL